MFPDGTENFCSMRLVYNLTDTNEAASRLVAVDYLSINLESFKETPPCVMRYEGGSLMKK